MRRPLLIALMLGLVLVLPGCRRRPEAVGNISLGSGGNPNIVVGEQATPVELFAAQELQRYLQQMTGTQLPIRTSATPASGPEILIGRADTNSRLAALLPPASHRDPGSEPGADGYRLLTVNGSRHPALLISGSNNRGTLYATYQLLEFLGVRFFGYQERGGEIVPATPKIEIPALDTRNSAAMKYRFVSDNGFSASDREKLLSIADWGAKNRCNAIMLTPSRPGESWKDIAVDELQKRGLIIAGPGHVLAQFTPDQSLFATHPEYFPYINGERQTTYSPTWGGAASFCVTNDEAMKIVVANALSYLRSNAFIDIFAVYPPDGSQRGAQCECPACGTLSSSDRYLRVANRLAEAMAKEYPTKKLMWIAYNEFGMPPRQVKPWNHGENMLLFWCNDIRVHDQPMDSDANRRPAPYLTWKPRLKTIKTDGAKNPHPEQLGARYRWRGWADFLSRSQFRGGAVVLDYYNQHVGDSLSIPSLRYCQSGPWDEDVLNVDMRFYRAEGISGWQNCTDYYNDAPNPYWNRLTAQTMWAPVSEIEAFRRDFYQHSYGPAAAEMEKYFTSLWHEILNPEVSAAATQRVRALEPLLAAAEARAKQAGDPSLTSRMKSARAFHKKAADLKQAMEAEFTPDGIPKNPTD